MGVFSFLFNISGTGSVIENFSPPELTLQPSPSVIGYPPFLHSEPTTPTHTLALEAGGCGPLHRDGSIRPPTATTTNPRAMVNKRGFVGVGSFPPWPFCRCPPRRKQDHAASSHGPVPTDERSRM
ncbi:hypothetical protein VTO42DRAFT_4847 [Malbranchea cinnamomea]